MWSSVKWSSQKHLILVLYGVSLTAAHISLQPPLLYTQPFQPKTLRNCYHLTCQQFTVCTTQQSVRPAPFKEPSGLRTKFIIIFLKVTISETTRKITCRSFSMFRKFWSDAHNANISFYMPQKINCLPLIRRVCATARFVTCLIPLCKTLNELPLYSSIVLFFAFAT